MSKELRYINKGNYEEKMLEIGRQIKNNKLWINLSDLAKLEYDF